MTVRPIDANQLYRIEKLLDTDIVKKDKVASELLEQVLYDIQHVPTLTPPNERLTCDGCISLGTSYGPCMNCIRSRLRGDMYRRPPEGEEDT